MESETNMLPQEISHFGEALVRLEGKLDVLNERQQRSNDDTKELRDRTNGHSTRLTVLEAYMHRRDGEERGFEKAIRAIYALAGVSTLALMATVAKFFISGG